MKIPQKLKVGGHIITIDCSKKMKTLDGQWVPSKNLIRICNSLPPSQKEVTIIHELLHAINSEFHSSTDKHMICDSLAQQLHQVLSDNDLLK